MHSGTAAAPDAEGGKVIERSGGWEVGGKEGRGGWLGVKSGWLGGRPRRRARLSLAPPAPPSATHPVYFVQRTHVHSVPRVEEQQFGASVGPGGRRRQRQPGRAGRGKRCQADRALPQQLIPALERHWRHGMGGDVATEGGNRRPRPLAAARPTARRSAARPSLGLAAVPIPSTPTSHPSEPPHRPRAP